MKLGFTFNYLSGSCDQSPSALAATDNKCAVRIGVLIARHSKIEIIEIARCRVAFVYDGSTSILVGAGQEASWERVKS